MEKEGTITGYKPIPVDTARTIADEFGKDKIVILAYDHDSQQTNVVTWGRDKFDKESAVIVASKCLNLMGISEENKITHQDYMHITAGERAVIVDNLIRGCRAADHALGSIIAVRDGIPDKQLNDIRQFIQNAINMAG